MTSIATAEEALTAAIDTVNEASNTLNALRAAAGQGHAVSPAELSDAGSALEIAQLQRENAETRLQQLIEHEAEEAKRAFAVRVEEFANRVPDTRGLLKAYRQATEAYVSAIAQHNAELMSLINEAEREDPSNTQTYRTRNVSGSTRGKPNYSSTYGLRTDNASCELLPTPKDEMNNILNTALRQLEGK